MTVLAVISPKGGVGKTSVSVNLSCALAEKGRSIRLVDLDPQNALRLHLGADMAENDGMAPQTLQQRSWRNAEFDSAYGVSFVPFGNVSEADRIALEAHLARTPSWLRDNLADLGHGADDLIVIDTPPGPSVYAQQALSIANIVLVVMISDAGSYATLPAIEGLLEHYCGNRPDFYGSYYVLNQFDASKSLNRDIKSVMQNDLGDRLAPCAVHRDESMSEALAYQQPVKRYAPYSQSVTDIEHLSVWMDDLLERIPK